MGMIKLTCATCGKVVTVKNRGGRKYCDDCKDLNPERREKVKAEREEREAAEYAALMKKHAEENPFDLSCKSLKRIDAEAKLFGMTYGTYTAACRCGFIIPILKDKGFKDPVKMLKKLEEKETNGT